MKRVQYTLLLLAIAGACTGGVMAGDEMPDGMSILKNVDRMTREQHVEITVSAKAVRERLGVEPAAACTASG